MPIPAIVFAIMTALVAGLSTQLSFTNPEPEPEIQRANIMFAGDMMFDRYIRKMMRVHGEDHVLSCVKDVLAQPDVVVANLEGPVTDAVSMSEGSVIGTPENFTFTFPLGTVGLLARHNIGLVNLGNNHIMNFGRWGLDQTVQYLDDGGVRYFGNPDVAESERVAQMDVRGVRFSFVSYSEWTSTSAESVRMNIAREHAAGRTVIVYTHWGDEYVPAPERVKTLARSFVENGASLVVGSHPHVVQEREDYRGVPIYYSLGNFVFDQYWNEDVRTGLLVDVVFADGRIESIRELHTELERDGRVCLKTLDPA